MRALIVGAGTMGRWFAELTRDWLDISIVDTDPAVAEAVATDLDIAITESDDVSRFPIVCTAVPLPMTPTVIAQYGDRAEEAMIDLSGIMDEPIDAMREHTSGCERISLHPLFAPENAPGNVAMVTEQGGSIADRLHEILADAGNAPFETTPEEHDRAMENVQAKVHAAIMAYAIAAEPVDEAFHTPISVELQRLTDHVLEGNPRVYADIQGRYEGAEAIARAATMIAAAGEEEFLDLHRDARDRHRSSPEHE